MKDIYFKILIVFLTYFLSACGGNNSSKLEDKKDKVKTVKREVKIPVFNADSAYYYVEKQTSFGPRVPGSEANRKCALWLENTLKRFTPDVTIQNFKTRIFDNRIFDGKNIIASFNKESKIRIILAAHWDSRPFADYDPDPANHNTPIDGANDGASGVGVLIEIARQLKTDKPPTGIDIILFDLEDYGPPQDRQTSRSADAWGLGSQYWAKNKHLPGYNARYGILLDMVGASDASFPMEGFSLYYAPDVVKKVWNIAHEIGYNDYFLFQDGAYITDDHYYINELANIPTIDIIHLEPNSVNGTFYDHWHTLEDNLMKIDKQTLNVVGQTVLTVIFRE